MSAALRMYVTTRANKTPDPAARSERAHLLQ